MQAIALTLAGMGDTSRELHLFDTFEGMPPPTEEDGRTRGGELVTAEELLATHDRDSKMWARATLDDVQAGMSQIVEYPAERIHYHPGLVEDTTPDEAPETIALLRLDTDWYASTKHELEHLYGRLSPGGILILDDSTSAIDSATEEEIQRALARVQAGRTTLLITHRLSMIRWADLIVVLDKGRIVATGDHTRLLASCAVYRRIFARFDIALPPLEAEAAAS